MVAPKGRGATEHAKLDKAQPRQVFDRQSKARNIPSFNPTVDGLFVPVCIHGEEYLFLVDTGASDTYISRRVYRNFEEDNRPQLQSQNSKAQLADGSSLHLYGVATLDLIIGPMKRSSTVLVADISSDGILGLDNLTKMGAKLDLTNFQLTTTFGNIQCVSQNGEKLFCRISASETTTIPAGHEAIILGTTKGRI